MTPLDILREFGLGLPTTMRDVVLARCCMGFGLLEGKANQDIPGDFAKALSGIDTIEAGYRCAAWCGVMELALFDEPNENGWIDKLAAEHPGNDTFTRMALQQPLKRKHWQDAAAQFHDLRQGVLSPEALRLWQTRRLASNHL